LCCILLPDIVDFEHRSHPFDIVRALYIKTNDGATLYTVY